MIKILIADDEPFIRQGIRSAIPWKQHDIEIIGEASNGKAALKLAIQHTPDIIIADIAMPVMTGLELAEQINDLLPETRVIILTAYGTPDNFTEAIRSKVSRFVLKSANSSAILENVLQVKAEIEEKRYTDHFYEQINHIYNENQHLIKSTLLARFLQNQLPPALFREKAQKVGISLTGPYYTMILARCASENDWHTIAAFHTSFEEFTPFACFVNDILLVLLNTDQTGITEPRFANILPEIKPYIVSNQLTCMNGIQDLEEFPISFQMLMNQLNNCFWNTDWPYSIISQERTFLAYNDSELLQYEKNIITAVLHENELLADQALLNYYNYCKKISLSRKVFLESVKRLLLLLVSVNAPQTDINALMVSVEDLESSDEIMCVIKSFLHAVPASEIQKPQITAALNYINENFDRDLRLSDVAKQIYLSEGYLSRMFKSETGYSFTEWLHRIRIEKAKEMILNTDLKYFEIAQKVGYKDYKYFSAYFNKLCGCSAKEYKMQKRMYDSTSAVTDLPQNG